MERSWKDIYFEIKSVIDEGMEGVLTKPMIEAKINPLLIEAGKRDGVESWYIDEIKKMASDVTLLNNAFSEEYRKTRNENEKKLSVSTIAQAPKKPKIVEKK